MSKQRVKTTNLAVSGQTVSLYEYSDLTVAEKIQHNAAKGGVLGLQELAKIDYWAREAGVRSDVQVIALTSGAIVVYGSGGRKVMHISAPPAEVVETKEGKGTLLTL